MRCDTIDAQVQTDHIVSKAESCQTDKVERTDYAIQADMEKEQQNLFNTPPRVKEESISIIDILTRDFSSSSDDSSNDEDDSRALESPEPKRFRPFDRVPGSTPKPFPVASESGLSKSPAGSKNDSEEKNDDDTILKNSEVYKIYCRHENPKQAIESIKKMKNCLSIIEGHKRNDQAIEIGIKTVWKYFGLENAPTDEFSVDLNLAKSFIGTSNTQASFQMTQILFLAG